MEKNWWKTIINCWKWLIYGLRFCRYNFSLFSLLHRGYMTWCELQVHESNSQPRISLQLHNFVRQKKYFTFRRQRRIPFPLNLWHQGERYNNSKFSESLYVPLIKTRYVRFSGIYFTFFALRSTNLHKHDYLLNIFSLEIESRLSLSFASSLLALRGLNRVSHKN